MKKKSKTKKTNSGRKKLRPGVHCVKVKKPNGGYIWRKVKVLANGRWRWLKGKCKGRSGKK